MVKVEELRIQLSLIKEGVYAPTAAMRKLFRCSQPQFVYNRTLWIFFSIIFGLREIIWITNIADKRSWVALSFREPRSFGCWYLSDRFPPLSSVPSKFDCIKKLVSVQYAPNLVPAGIPAYFGFSLLEKHHLNNC